MKNIKNMKNGALYYNTETERSERLVGNINTQRVWTVFHKEQPVAVRLKDLRIANAVELNKYRMEAEGWPVKSALPKLPPLPVPAGLSARQLPAESI